MISVVNKYHQSSPTDLPPGDLIQVYIGRPSSLGNPFSHLPNTTLSKYKVATREEAIAKYREWLEWAVCNDVEVKTAIDQIVHYVINGKDVELVCFCAPKPCHGDVIKRYIDHLIWEAKQHYQPSPEDEPPKF